MVKDERHIDRFDRAFAASFEGLEQIGAEQVLEAVDLPEEWLRRRGRVAGGWSGRWERRCTTCSRGSPRSTRCLDSGPAAAGPDPATTSRAGNASSCPQGKQRQAGPGRGRSTCKAGHTRRPGSGRPRRRSAGAASPLRSSRRWRQGQPLAWGPARERLPAAYPRCRRCDKLLWCHGCRRARAKQSKALKLSTATGYMLGRDSCFVLPMTVAGCSNDRRVGEVAVKRRAAAGDTAHSREELQRGLIN